MVDRLREIEARYRQLEQEMSRPEVIADHERLAALGREQASLRPLVEAFREYQAVRVQLEEAREMLHAERDGEMQEYLRSEERSAEARLAELDAQLKELLLPKDPNDERDVIMEIQGAEGGDEAELFARDLLNMYVRYSQSKGWKVELLELQESGIGGISRVEFEVQGRGAYSHLKFEGGVHRVQRVPKTEAKGRIHTSAATVAVLPEADPVEVELPEKDLKIETSTSQGPGGQSVNTTYSKVIITHLPTGIVVSMQDEKSQIKNREKALRVLRARIYERKLAEAHAAEDAQRRSMVKTGNRSEKVRTYNFPQNRVTDHRIGLDLHKLDKILQGDLDELITALISAERSRLLTDDAA